MPRLPIPGEDAGTWGDILNEFLEISHEPDGSLKNINLDLISNVNAGSAQEGDVLVFDSATSTWLADTPVVTENLNDLVDVNISNPQVGDTLTYNGSVWERSTPYAPTKPQIVNFSSSGTFSKANYSGMKYVKVSIVGGGGGGQRGRGGHIRGGAGGGAGGGGISYFTVNELPTSVSVSIGAGGTGNTGGGNTNGGASSFGSLISVGGGERGLGDPTDGAGRGGNGGAGGGQMPFRGGGGGGGHAGSNNSSGIGGNSMMTGVSRGNSGAHGLAGTRGSGGSGGHTKSNSTGTYGNGANGGAGYCTIEIYY